MKLLPRALATISADKNRLENSEHTRSRSDPRAHESLNISTTKGETALERRGGDPEKKSAVARKSPERDTFFSSLSLPEIGTVSELIVCDGAMGFGRAGQRRAISCPVRGTRERAIPLAQRNFNKLAIMRGQGGRERGTGGSPVFCAFADNDAGRYTSLSLLVSCLSERRGAVSSRGGLSGLRVGRG